MEVVVVVVVLVVNLVLVVNGKYPQRKNRKTSRVVLNPQNGEKFQNRHHRHRTTTENERSLNHMKIQSFNKKKMPSTVVPRRREDTCKGTTAVFACYPDYNPCSSIVEL